MLKNSKGEKRNGNTKFVHRVCTFSYDGTGDITDADLKFANTFHAVIIGFKIKLKSEWRLLSDQLKIKIISSDVIYEAIKEFEEYLEAQIKGEKEYLGELEVLALFSESKKGQLIGGKILIGNISLNKRIDIFRGIEKIGDGKIVNVRIGKQEAKSVPQGKECGIIVQTSIKIEVGDVLKTF